MRKLAIPLAVGAAALLGTVFASPALAQAVRTWVSGVGDDVNPCSRTAPCKTFAGAISKTFIGGEINCLDPGGFGTLTITKSLTIDCHWTHGSILASLTTGININIPANANDPLRTVRLRGLSINGAGASGAVGTRTGVRGISITNMVNVFLDDVLITQFTQQGINDASTSAGGRLSIRNSIIRDNSGSGLSAIGAATHATILDNVSVIGNAFGVAAGNGNNVTIKRSTMSGNSTAGVQADVGSQVNIDDSVITNNGTGVVATGTVRLSNSDIAFNNTGISGTANSFGNNRISGNGGAGTAPTPIGGDSHDKGQQ